MTHIDLEALAEEVYDMAGLRADRASTPLYIATRVLDRVEFAYTLSSVVVLRGNSLLVRRGVSPRMRGWRTARALAFWALRRRDIRRPNLITVDALAACLRTPRQAFTRIARETGADFPELADVFGTSESAAALRYGETTGRRLTLLAPPLAPRVRGVGPIKGIARTVPLRDAPNRRVRLYA